MLTRPLIAAALAALICSAGLAGCSSSQTGVVTHTPALQTTGGRSTARSGAQLAVLVPDATNGIALPGGPTPAGIARRIMAIHDRRTSATGGATGACVNGVKQSQTTNGTTGVTTTITDWYYDATCTTLETEEIINNPPSSSTANGTGTIMSYGSTGTLRVAEKLTFTVSTTPASGSNPATETITLEITASATQGGTTSSQVGATCVGQPGTAIVNCSGAHNGVSGGVAFGEAFATTGSAATSSSGATASVNISFFLGGTLGIGQSGTTWSVTGNGAFNTGTGTVTYLGASNSGAASLTVKDLLYTYNENATVSSSGAISVTIIQKPNGIVTSDTPIATASIDPGGNGTINYADGTSETLAGGLVGY